MQFRWLLALICVISIFGVSKADNCDTCKYVVTIVEQFVENNSTEQEILQFLEGICADIPAFEAICDQIAQYGLEEFVAWIQANGDPTTICTEIGLCSSASSPITTPPTKFGDTCSQCEQVVSLVEAWIASAATQQEIIQMLEAVCSAIPAFEQICDAVVEYGVPEVIAWIQKYENATVVCQQLGLCSSNQKVILPPNNKQNQAGGYCSECQMVVSYIEQWLASGATQQEIEQYLEGVCVILPESFQSVCQALIQQGVPTIIAWIEQYEDPTTICTQIGLCSSAKSQMKPMPIKIRVGDTGNCDICKSLITLVEQWLADNKTVSVIEQDLLNYVCALVPQMETVCDTIVYYGIPQLVAWIQEYESPAIVCQQIGLCSAANVAVKPLNKVLIN